MSAIASRFVGFYTTVRSQFTRVFDPGAAFRALVAEGVVIVGRHTFGRPTVHVWRDSLGRPLGSKVYIGNFVTIAPDVEIFSGGEHRTDWISTYPFRILWDLPGAYTDGHPATKGDVHVGHDVWIGAGAKVLSGVHIGNGAVIGSQCVVARSVRPYAIVVGNPAREIRRRFSDSDVELLERLAWWNWPDEEILRHVPLLSSPDVARLIRADRVGGNNR